MIIVADKMLGRRELKHMDHNISDDSGIRNRLDSLKIIGELNIDGTRFQTLFVIQLYFYL